MPNFLEYHKSIAEEMQAVKNRIRNLVDHRLTMGEQKEAVLRSVLRRHLPDSLFIGRGFIVNRTDCSTQIDVLIVDRSAPTLFKDGDLVIVTPDAVRAIIEVKTQLVGEAQVKTAVDALVANSVMCDSRIGALRPWTGILDFDTERIDHPNLLRPLRAAWNDAENRRCAVNCICLGTRHFVRYWPTTPMESIKTGNVERTEDQPCRWESYELEGLAPAYFLGNLIEYLSPHGPHSNPGYAWFPLTQGKGPYRKWQITVDSNEPEEVPPD